MEKIRSLVRADKVHSFPHRWVERRRDIRPALREENNDVLTKWVQLLNWLSSIEVKNFVGLILSFSVAFPCHRTRAVCVAVCTPNGNKFSPFSKLWAPVCARLVVHKHTVNLIEGLLLYKSYPSRVRPSVCVCVLGERWRNGWKSSLEASCALDAFALLSGEC